jgi:hypothetical protein
MKTKLLKLYRAKVAALGTNKRNVINMLNFDMLKRVVLTVLGRLYKVKGRVQLQLYFSYGPS